MLAANVIIKAPLFNGSATEFRVFNIDDATDKLLVVDMSLYRKGSRECATLISGNGGYTVYRENFESFTILPQLDRDAKTILGVMVICNKRGVPFFKGEWSTLGDGYVNIIHDKKGYYA